MNGSLDGLESVSLMQHGVGRNYTGDPTMGGRDDDDGVEGRINPKKSASDKSEEVDYVESDAPLLSQFHEDAIQQAGMGPFQRILLFITGLGLAADTIELFVVAYVIPSAEVELCMSGEMKGWLAAITFVGMMIGAVIWGTLSDRLGRRRALLSALFINAIFGLMTAFMPTYGIFMTTRLCSGIGIGGGIPIIFAYYCEFISRSDRGRHLSWLLVFWAIGGVFTAVMAWAIIPRTGKTVVLDEELHFSSWRIFLAVCSLPAFASVVGLYFMPESPRFLLEQGRDVEAMMVYKKIFKWNNAQNPKAEYHLTELELPSGIHRPLKISPHTTGRSFFGDVSNDFQHFWTLLRLLFKKPHLYRTFILMIIWFTCAFGFYGLSVWFPEYIKLLQSEEYNSKSRVITDDFYSGDIKNRTIDNVIYMKTMFNNVTFEKITFNHVTFNNCQIFDSTFTDVRSSKTIFIDSYIARNNFVDTDLYPYRFQNCQMSDNKFRPYVPGCRELDFDYNIHYKDVFQENLIGQLTLIPGTIVAALLMDRVGRVKMMSSSMILSAISAFFIWFLDTKTGIIVFEAVFNFIFIAGWNALDITTTEAFPAHIRTTAYGFLSATSRIAGILGSLCFGHFLYTGREIPMLMTTAVLFFGGIISLKMEETKDMLM